MPTARPSIVASVVAVSVSSNDAGERRDGADGDADADQRGQQRQAGGHHRAERDRQDQEADHDAEHLGGRLVLLGDEAAAELDLHPAALAGSALASSSSRAASSTSSAGIGVDHVRVADRAVLRDRLRRVGIDDLRHALGLRGPLDGLHHGGLVLGVGELLARRGLVYDARRGSAGAGVLLVQQVLGTLGLGARDLELARELRR